MAHFVNVAAVQFQPTIYYDGHHDWDRLREGALESTAKTLDSLGGQGLDLIVLSESISAIGQTSANAENVKTPGPFLRLYMDFARREKTHLVGSCLLREGERVYNSAVVIGPQGILGRYRKTFPVPEELEQGISPGNGAAVIDTPVGRIGAAICFDLNFGELRHAYAELHPQIIAFPSMYHGGLVQEIWAYECRSYFVSATCFENCGILDPFGRPLALADDYTRVPRARINLDYVMSHRSSCIKRIPDMRRKYGLEISIEVPAHVGVALISSASPDRTARDIAREFELELLDDYLARCRALVRKQA